MEEGSILTSVFLCVAPICHTSCQHDHQMSVRDQLWYQVIYKWKLAQEWVLLFDAQQFFIFCELVPESFAGNEHGIRFTRVQSDSTNFADQLSSCCKLVFKLDLNVWMLDMAAEELIEVSSAKISTVVFCPMTPTGSSLMKIRKRRGASTEPWGTPWVKSWNEDNLPLISVACLYYASKDTMTLAPLR